MRLVWFSVVLGVVFVVISASCGTPTKCNQATCPTGCCDTSGLCKPGSTTSQCGRGGNSCTACLLGQTCDLGTCNGGFNNGAGTAGAGTAGGGFVSSGGSAGGGSAGGGAAGGGLAAGGGMVTGGGATGPCNTTTCSGCCDFSGTCQPGNSTNACGSRTATNGVCVQCGGGQTCSAGMCVTGAGGGGPSCGNGCLFSGQCLVAGTTMQNNSLCGNNGSTCRTCTSPTPVCQGGFCVPAGSAGGTATAGGAAGGGGTGGGTTGCTPLSLPSGFPGGSFSQLRSGYQFFGPGSFNFAEFTSTGLTGQFIGFELVRATAGVPALPYSGAITTANYDSCQNCVQFAEGCTAFTPSLLCDRRYLAQSGTFAVSNANESGTAGIGNSFVGSVSGVTFREWNFASPEGPVAGGRCYTLSAASFSGSW